MEKDFYLSFSLSPIGPKRFKKLLEIFGSAEKAWKRAEDDFKKAGVGEKVFAKFDLFRKKLDCKQYLEKLKKTKVEIIAQFEKEYPKKLLELSDAPIVLFAKGNKNLLFAENIIGVVGTRKITSYGKQVTEDLVSSLSSAGFIIASGMALGVDGIAHKTAIDCQVKWQGYPLPNLPKGSTIAVLGCGVDCPYPRENQNLYEEILDSGGLIISEYPLGMLANKGTFPARNRIIAGISLAVLVTEAGKDSGSLITASNAASQGRTVFAVPGPITSRMSDGTSKLLKEGAVLVSSAEDILESLNIKNIPTNFIRAGSRMKTIIGTFKKFKISREERKILGAIEYEGLTIDEISRMTKIPIGKLSIILSEMELKGLVKNSGGKFSSI